MKINYTFNVLYWIRKSGTKGTCFPIYARITIDGKRTEVTTKRSVELSQWDGSRQLVKGNDENARSINQYLAVLRGEIEKIHLQLSVNDIIPQPSQIKRILLGETDEPKHKTICEAFDYLQLKHADLVKISKMTQKTYDRYTITKNKVIAFMQKKYNAADKPLPELRLSFVTEFEHFLLTDHKIQSNTTHKYIKNLKKVMNAAVGADWIPSNPFNLFKCSYIEPEKEILTQQELDNLMNKELTNPRLAEVRDVFVFCCYTGFAYCDLYKFSDQAVTLGIDGQSWLMTKRTKTKVKESVPLLPIPLAIIEKYKTHPYCVKYNRLLPVNTNQRYNEYIKEVASLAGIHKHITTHTARHTFATTVTLTNGVPIETVSSMLGHKSLRTTQGYAKIVQKKVSEDMLALRNKLNVAAEHKLQIISAG